jgi:hypothetical protein
MLVGKAEGVEAKWRKKQPRDDRPSGSVASLATDLARESLAGDVVVAPVEETAAAATEPRRPAPLLGGGDRPRARTISSCRPS